MVLSIAEIPLPIRLRPATPMSEDELLRFCAANRDLRVERDATGELIVMSPTGSESGGRNMDIGTDLNIWTRQDGRGKAFDSNAGFTLPDGSMRSADAAWILNSRWEALSKEERRRFAPICPDFIIELRSPTDSLPELQAKMREWMKNGVQRAWLIDPENETVSIYRMGEQPEIHQHPTSVQGDGVVAGFELVMDRIWD